MLATDNEDGNTWHYAWIAGTAVCDSTATFPSGSNYTEGADLAYTSTDYATLGVMRRQVTLLVAPSLVGLGEGNMV